MDEEEAQLLRSAVVSVVLVAAGLAVLAAQEDASAGAALAGRAAPAAPAPLPQAAHAAPGPASVRFAGGAQAWRPARPRQAGLPDVIAGKSTIESWRAK